MNEESNSTANASPNSEAETINNLKTLTPERIRDAFESQQKSTEWTFYSEREFIENLFNQRFNYLIVMYSLFITASASVNSKQNLLIVLILDFFFSLLMSLTIYRAYVKLIILLRILYKLDPNHVFPIVHTEIETWKWKKLFPANSIIGIVIPIAILLSFVIGTILACFDIITAKC